MCSSDLVLMLEHAIYSVISPEGASSILWREAGKAEDAATSMKITAQDLLRFGIIDTVVAEPPGGAHRDPVAVFASTEAAIAKALQEFEGLSREAVIAARADKFLAIGRR